MWDTKPQTSWQAYWKIWFPLAGELTWKCWGVGMGKESQRGETQTQTQGGVSWRAQRRTLQTSGSLGGRDKVGRDARSKCGASSCLDSSRVSPACGFDSLSLSFSRVAETVARWTPGLTLQPLAQHSTLPLEALHNSEWDLHIRIELQY